MKTETKAEKIKRILMADSTTPVDKIAKRFKVAPSYVYRIRLKLRGEHVNELVNEPFTPEEEEALDRLFATRTDEGWQVTSSLVTGAEVLTAPLNALDTQVAGSHYKGKKIQPVEYIHANKLNFLEGCIVKRITRWREKDGFQDLEKIKHEVDLLIEMEKKYANGN
jgi:hypothetical protein